LPVIRDLRHGLEFQFFQSQLKDDRQVRPEIRLLFSPVTIQFNFE